MEKSLSVRHLISSPDWLHAFIVGLTLFILYATTTPHTVALEDDGLFIMASHFLGVAHPPGYPTHTLIGKLFTLIPFGSIAYRVHLVSAFFGAATCSLAWLICRKLNFRRLAAYGAAFSLGVSDVFWSQSIIAEVYTLNTFFFLAVLLIVLNCTDKYSSNNNAASNLRTLSFGAFIYGLSLTNHWPLMILASPALLWLLWPQRKTIIRHLARLTSFFLIGLTPYAWMVYRSQSNPVINFDGPIESLTELFLVISRSNYGQVDSRIAADWSDTLQFATFTLSESASQFTLLGLIIAIFGIHWLWQTRQQFLIATALAFLFTAALLVLLVNFEYDYFWTSVFRVYLLPLYCIMAIWIGAGLEYARTNIPLLQTSKHANLSLAAGLSCLIFFIHYPKNNRSDYNWSYKYATSILNSTPPNADLFLVGDIATAVIGYFHLVENMRPDIRLFNRHGLIFSTRLSHPLRTPETKRMDAISHFATTTTRPLLFTNRPTKGVAHIPHTLKWLVVEIKAGQKENQTQLPNDHLQIFNSLISEHNDPDIWTKYWQAELRRSYAAALIVSKSQNRLPTPEKYEAALKEATMDYYGKLGALEGYLVIPKQQRPTLSELIHLIELAGQQMPANVKKEYMGRFFELKAYLRREAGDMKGAADDMRMANSIWPQGVARTRKWLESLEQSLAKKRTASD